MGRVRAPYSPEFRQKMIELVRSGRSPEDLEKEFEPTAMSIRAWVQKDDLKNNPSPVEQVSKLDERKELEQLRKEVKILREERDILKKAAAWFAQEIGVPSTKRSNS